MRSKPLIMIGLAIVSGGLGLLSAQRWISRQASMQQPAAVVTAEPPPPMNTIVVAASPLRYGTDIAPSHVREVPWPSATLPDGAFKTVAELLAGNGKRVVLSAIEPNEPVLQAKVTGPGQRGTLSALIEEGMGAVTIHVNEVVGIAGFVLPGDRVDVLMTRQQKGDLVAAPEVTFTDVVLRNVRVLAVGQTADDRAEKPSLVSAVTLEVDPVAAQKIAVATAAGSLSLVLRRAGEVASQPTRRVSLSELGHEPKGTSDQRMVRVTRAMQAQEYTVPVAAMTAPSTMASPRPVTRPRVAAAP